MRPTTCQFCKEIEGTGHTRFHEIYASVLPNRMVGDRRHFVAFPTLGQLVPGSLLLVPKEHVETFAQLPRALQLQSVHFMNHLESRLRCYGHLFTFEHGARCASGGGCGIYHAHVHLVPLPRPVSYGELLDFSVHHADNLLDVWSELKDCSEYLAVKDSHGTVVYCTPNESSRGFGSQFLRRSIAEYLSIEQPWDWRAYTSPEPFLLETVETLRTR